MSLRTFSLLPFLVLLAACGRPDNEKLAEAEEDLAEEAAAQGLVECALGDGALFSRVCETERISGPEGTILVIHHPDGGFRRFVILTDGRGLAAADGFDDTEVAIIADGMIEVASGGNRYRLPAAVKSRSNGEAGAQASAGSSDGAGQ